MVGTPQLPLKYRRKGISDYYVYNGDLDMTSRFPSSSVNSYGYDSDHSFPYSPTFYSSSSSNAPSSPVRSLYTPEPPSSPLIEPHIEASPKTPKPNSRRGFWEVAVNYGPDFPYKSGTLPRTAEFNHEPFLARRRGSSASAPALVSDADPSEYSEDNDPFRTDDDATDGANTLTSITIVNPRDDLTVDVSPASVLVQDDGSNIDNSQNVKDGEIDVAAVLLDLSRQVRLAPAESSAVAVAIGPSISISVEATINQGNRMSSCDSPPVTVAGVPPLAPVEAEIHQVCSALSSPQGVGQSSECETHVDIEKFGNIRSEHDVAAFDIIVVEDRQSPSDVLPNSSAPSGLLHDDSEVSSESIAVGNIENAIAPDLPDEIPAVLVPLEKMHASIGESDLNFDPITDSIFSVDLTPLSSPALSSSGLSDLPAPLSEVPSPKIGGLELTGPGDSTDDTRHPQGSRSSSPSSDPGPSNARICSADQYIEIPENKVRSHERTRKSRSGAGASMVDVDITYSAGFEAKEIGKKRARSTSTVGSRPSSPSLSASCSYASVPRKKRSRKLAGKSDESLDGDATLSASRMQPSSSLILCALPAHSSLVLNDVEMDSERSVTCEKNDVNARSEICGCLIQAMALSRASSMPASSLLREVLRENPHLNNQWSKADWLSIVAQVLECHDVFGRIDREGLDADDKPLEAQWFYIPENDPDQDRALLLREMMPQKRNETKKHKQYFFKPLGKISRWDPEDAP